jgi:hypothetical protein
LFCAFVNSHARDEEQSTSGAGVMAEPVETAEKDVGITPHAVYGTNVATGGTVPFTGYTPTLGTGGANVPSANGAVQFNGYNQFDSNINHYFRIPGGRSLRRMLRALVGVAPGATAQEFRTRVQGRTNTASYTYGGVQPLEQVPYINRVTTAADVTGIVALLDRVVAPPIYPVDVGGNGGGGMLKYKGIG